jgi:hypothetical protein
VVVKRLGVCYGGDRANRLVRGANLTNRWYRSEDEIIMWLSCGDRTGIWLTQRSCGVYIGMGGGGVVEM